MWLGEFGLAMKRVWRIDLANHPPLRCRSDRPIWRRFSGSCCTDVLPQPCSILYPLPPAPFPLDLLGSGEHSCACPFGPPRIALSWRHQRSRSGPNGQPPESSQTSLSALDDLEPGPHGFAREDDFAQRRPAVELRYPCSKTAAIEI